MPFPKIDSGDVKKAFGNNPSSLRVAYVTEEGELTYSLNVTSSELVALNNIDDNIQDQLNTKTTANFSGSPESAQAAFVNENGELAYSATVTKTELESLNGIETNVQTQINDLKNTVQSVSGTFTVSSMKDGQWYCTTAFSDGSVIQLMKNSSRQLFFSYAATPLGARRSMVVTGTCRYYLSTTSWDNVLTIVPDPSGLQNQSFGYAYSSSSAHVYLNAHISVADNTTSGLTPILLSISSQSNGLALCVKATKLGA